MSACDPLILPPLLERPPTEISIARKTAYATPPLLGPSQSCDHLPKYNPITGKRTEYTTYYKTPKHVGIPLCMKVHKGSLFTDAGYVYYSGCYDICPDWTSESRTSLPRITDTTIVTRNNSAAVQSTIRAGDSIVSRLCTRQRLTLPDADEQF